MRVVKVTAKFLHENGISNGKKSGNAVLRVEENIEKEGQILKYVSKQSDFPKCIVKQHKFYERYKTTIYIWTNQKQLVYIYTAHIHKITNSADHYMLVMEDAGSGLFNFVQKAHSLIQHGRLTIPEWQRVTKHIFKQMIEAVEYIHNLRICHFDISLENFVINNVQIAEKRGIDNKKSISFLLNSVQATLIDFGLSEYFASASFESNKYCGKQLYCSPEVQMKRGYFSAISNDVYALGVCLFCMTLGASPYRKPKETDDLFCWMIRGDIKQVLASWNKLHFVDDDWLDLMKSIFQYERNRIDLKGIKTHSWLK